MTPIRRLLFSFSVALILTGCGDSITHPVQGDAAPPFELRDLDGNLVRFPDDFRGATVAVRFWADWCPFCESEMRALEPVFRRHNEEMTILAVNVRQSHEKAAAFVAKLGISYPTLLDEQGEVARTYGVTGLPMTFFVDGRAVLQRKILGESTPEMFERLIIETRSPNRDR